MAPSAKKLIPIERIERAILLIRGEKAMLDSDLAALYGVQTRELVQAVTRNIARFPLDFAYQLIWEEFRNLMSQTVTSKSGHGGAERDHGSSPNMGWQCFRACCEVNGRLP